MREIAASPDRPTCLSPRPTITIKIAQTLDGRIATQAGQSQWITCEAAARWPTSFGRAHDAVLVGIGTVLHDNPAPDGAPGGWPRSAAGRRRHDVRIPLDRAC